MERLNEEWVTAIRTQQVFTALKAAGHQGYFVGGCVRDALLGRAVTDIDMATDARPDVVVRACELAGLRVIPTGLAHGTVTVVSRGKPHEVTTFRRDVATDGRRAVVAFSDEISDDAARRDFTMNALYADEMGHVLDPLGQGLADLRARRVRFIGKPGDRIAEDYLRILRFFRFHAWLGQPGDGPDVDAMAAIGDHLDGLAQLSGERVTAEVLKLLAAPDPAPASAAMQAAGVLGRILPGADASALAPLVHLEAGRQANPIRRLAALGAATDRSVLRLSRAQLRELDQIETIVTSDMAVEESAYRHGAARAMDAALVRHALLGQPLPNGLGRRVAHAASQEFPVRAADLPGLAGADLGARLTALEAAWISSGFRLQRDELLAL